MTQDSSTEAPAENGPAQTSLEALTAALTGNEHLLASSGDARIATAALQVAKEVFDLGLTLEQQSHPHLHPFLLQILDPPALGLRSRSKAKEAEAEKEEEEAVEVDVNAVLPYTPLSELTTAGMDPEQIWSQLELRAEPVVKVVKEVGSGEEERDDEDEETDDGFDDEEDGSDEEMTIEEFNRMMAEEGVDENADSDDESDEDDSEGESADEESEMDSDEANEFSFGDGIDDDGEEEDDDLSVGSSIDDDEDEGDEEDEDEDEDEDEEADDDDDEGDDGSDAAGVDDDEEALFGQAGPSRSKRLHPTLDDKFFSIDEFNRLTEEAEAGKVTSGRLGGDEDEDDEDDLGDAGALMLQSGEDEDDTIMYGDFFDAPRPVRVPGKKDTGKGKGKGKEKEKPKSKSESKGKGVHFGEEDDMMDGLDEEDEEEDDEEEEEDRDVMGRVKGDLFDSDDEDGEEAEQNLSTHEKQQRALAKQIAELEAEAIGPKDWTLLGEATSRARPENSLLEEDLDFEQVSKVVPVITEEGVKSLEDLIKKRIIDNNFNSPVRVRAYEPTPYLASRYFDLQDTQSAKSLAQIYEEDFQAAASGSKTRDPRDEKLSKEHEEIDKLWGEICYKLDALSSLNFVPKQPKAQITTVDNLPTTTMESALPPTSAATTLLAPEELFRPPTSSNLVSRSELTPEQAQAARSKRKREKKGDRKRLGDMAELYAKKKGGVKGEKERALQGLVKSGKGVTVVGKGDKEAGKARKRAMGQDGTERHDGKRLKL